MIDRMEQVATVSDAPILLLGPSGTGKTELAGCIYEFKLQRRRGSRAASFMRPVAC
jgi:transcriptional regulatory protein RtcR